MIDFKITLQADEILFEDYEKKSLTSEIMFREFLWQFKAKTALTPQQNLNTLCCQGIVSAIVDLTSDFKCFFFC